MSSLIKRGAILAFARLLSQALMMLSPIILVRLLDVIEFGLYRQFTVTTTFLNAIGEFAIAGSVTYFASRSDTEPRKVMTCAALLLLASSAIMVLAVLVAPSLIVPEEIRAYAPFVAGYVFFYLNLDIVISYWLAIRRADLVMFYTVSMVAVRLVAVSLAALVGKDIGTVLATLVAVEAVKCAGLLIYLVRAKLLSFGAFDTAMLKTQLAFVVPTGTGSVLYKLNENISRLTVAAVMGPIQTAIFAIAAYQVPIVSVLKASLSEAIFPDMVSRGEGAAIRALRLWQKTNVLYFFVVLPCWVLMTYFARDIIVILFTEDYVAATPYFQALLLVMLRNCFDFSTPLRSISRTRPFVTANIVALAINVTILALLIGKYGLWAATIALLASQAWLMVYLAHVVCQAFGVGVADVLQWSKLGKLASACAAATVALGLVNVLGDSVWAAIAGLGAFGIVYLVTVFLLAVEEVEYLRRKLWSVLRRK